MKEFFEQYEKMLKPIFEQNKKIIEQTIPIFEQNKKIVEQIVEQITEQITEQIKNMPEIYMPEIKNLIKTEIIAVLPMNVSPINVNNFADELEKKIIEIKNKK